ncbi:MAG: alpha/beta hydrolase [Pirellulaceae bacterium]|nr:alpha/beta hydrolase [Pirellulaceae bacterium]
MRNLRIVDLIPVFLLALFVAVAAHAQDEKKARPTERRESNQDRLPQLLKRFPDADANKDGTLTEEEAIAYRSKNQKRETTTDRKNQSPNQAKNSKEAAAGRGQPTQKDVAYGTHERNVLDFYQAKSDKPTPLIIYIHGGGFVGGDKNSINGGMLKAANEAGISMASLHYRFVDGTKVIFPTPQHDCARALQFLRSKATEWNIDPKRIACYGGSAGAGISMWLGFHDDLADPNSTDPIARQSTRIVAIGTNGGQGTYDPIKIKELIGGRAWEHPSIFKVYGVTSAEEALRPTPERQKLYDEGSAITHLTKDDPPLYMTYSEADIVPPTDSRPGQFIHHPNFGKQLKKSMDELGIKNVYVHTADAKDRNPQNEMLEFFQQEFAKVK